MILLLWPLVVFAFYKKINTLKTILFIVHISFAIIGVIGAREYVLIALLQQIIAILFIGCLHGSQRGVFADP